MALVAYHARGAEATGDTARTHALQVVVLAGFGTLEPFSPRVISGAHQLDHGGPAGQAPFALEVEESKEVNASPFHPVLGPPTPVQPSRDPAAHSPGSGAPVGLTLSQAPPVRLDGGFIYSSEPLIFAYIEGISPAVRIPMSAHSSFP